MNFKNVFSVQSLIYPSLMVLLMWLTYFFQIQGLFQNCWGAIIPLAPDGLKGIIFSPFLHGSLEHIVGNSIPVFILMFLLFQFYPFIAGKVFIRGWLITGFLVWLLPPIDFITGEYHYTCIIGASGIVYFLAFFLFFSGVFRWDMKLLTISLLVALYYGSLIWGIFPEDFFYELSKPSTISWQSHLSGAVVGIAMAFFYKEKGEKKKKFIWEFPNYYSEKDDQLWLEYKENFPEDFEDLPYKRKEDIWDHLEKLRKGEN